MAQALNKILILLEIELIINRLITKIHFNLRLIPKILMFIFQLLSNLRYNRSFYNKSL